MTEVTSFSLCPLRWQSLVRLRCCFLHCLLLPDTLHCCCSATTICGFSAGTVYKGSIEVQSIIIKNSQVLGFISLLKDITVTLASCYGICSVLSQRKEGTLLNQQHHCLQVFYSNPRTDLSLSLQACKIWQDHKPEWAGCIFFLMFHNKKRAWTESHRIFFLEGIHFDDKRPTYS